jgi:hypothetical protein
MDLPVPTLERRLDSSLEMSAALFLGVRSTAARAAAAAAVDLRVRPEAAAVEVAAFFVSLLIPLRLQTQPTFMQMAVSGATRRRAEMATLAAAVEVAVVACC